MRHTLIIAGMLALPVMLAAHGARAQFISGAELAKACALNSRESASCTAFIAGAMDEVAVTPELKAKVCLPAGTKLKTLRESLASYVAERPDAARGTGVELVNAMVVSHFPCKPQTS